MSAIKKYPFRGEYVIGWEYEDHSGQQLGVINKVWMPNTEGLAFDATPADNKQMPLKAGCYITREQLAELLPILQRYVETGELSADE